jgi:hypothetical protein
MSSTCHQHTCHQHVIHSALKSVSFLENPMSTDVTRNLATPWMHQFIWWPPRPLGFGIGEGGGAPVIGHGAVVFKSVSPDSVWPDFFGFYVYFAHIRLVEYDYWEQ